MPNNVNFLLGYGERLTDRIAPPPTNPEKAQPYTFSEARQRIAPMLKRTVEAIRHLPQLACPHNEAVAVLRIHPEFIAKSYFPARLLTEVGLTPIGSRPAWTTPEKWSRKGKPRQIETTDLFVAAPRPKFESWSRSLSSWTDRHPAAADVGHVEEVLAPTPIERIQPITNGDPELFLEVVLHASAARSSQFILEAFEEWSRSAEAKLFLDRRLYVGGLCFLPIYAQQRRIEQIAEFSFLRTVRQMPQLRILKPPVLRSSGRRSRCTLPAPTSVSSVSRVAIFDGGLPPTSSLAPWVTAIDAPGVGGALPGYLEHGEQVTSAFLFGSVAADGKIERPFSSVHHYRVLDAVSANDPLELYDVLSRIRNVLASQHYDLINLSIGPELPIEDNDVHAWTAFLDEHLENGDVLATVAAGNGGENDRASGNTRIQVPADSVNALTVGACDSQSPNWQRAAYSSFGPGRSPGVVKPDCLGFGGCDAEPFLVATKSAPAQLNGTCGTSFAAPAILRIAAGVRAYLGPVISPLALKALHVHCCEPRPDDRIECGWGRTKPAVEDLIVCPEGTARIVYQGELTAGQFLRAQIPVPAASLKGLVSIRATFCYATPTDPEHPGAYTRSGLDVRFRPHDQRFGDSTNPKSNPFFQVGEFATELELRRDAHKWETTLHREKRFRSDSLRNPVFDIHYVAREGGGGAAIAKKIRYALIVSVFAPNVTDLYDQIRRRYSTTLVPLQPIISVPLRVQS